MENIQPIISYIALGLLVLILIGAAVVDIRRRKIPNASVIAVIGIWLIWNAASIVLMCLSGMNFIDALVKDDPITGVSALEGIGAALVYGAGILLLSVIFERITGRSSMGGGDIKLLFATSLYLGIFWQGAALVLACVCSLIMGLFVKRLRNDIPFGVGIAIGTIVCLLLMLV